MLVYVSVYMYASSTYLLVVHLVVPCIVVVVVETPLVVVAVLVVVLVVVLIVRLRAVVAHTVEGELAAVCIVYSVYNGGKCMYSDNGGV
jgi:hypothetical protein